MFGSIGWWPEGFDGKNGFAIVGTPSRSGAAARDQADAEALYAVLEDELIPEFSFRGELFPLLFIYFESTILGSFSKLGGVLTPAFFFRELISFILVDCFAMGYGLVASRAI